MAKKRRRAPVSKHTAPKTVEKKTAKFNPAILKNICVYVILVVLAGTPFFIGKYIEFNTPGPFDSGSYVYSAQNIASGARLFVDEIPSAQPATLLINFIGVKLFGFSETGPMIMQTLLQLAAFVMVFIAVRKMCGSIPAVVSVVLASVFLSSPLVAKFGNVKEQFMIAFMLITASCFILRQMGGKWWWSLLTGAFAVNIYYFKQTGTSVIIAIVVYMIVSVAVAPKKWRLVGADLLLILAGALIGLLPLYSFYAWQNVLHLFYRTLPAFVMISILKLSFIVLGVYILVRLAKHFNLLMHLKKFRQVRKSVWIGGAVAVAVVFIPCLYFYHSMVIVDVVLPFEELDQPITSADSPEYKMVIAELEKIEEVGYMDYYRSLSKRDLKLKKGGELGSYFNSIAFVKYPKSILGYPVRIIKDTTGKFTAIISRLSADEGYLGSSRKSLSLKDQSKKVFSFYRALILPVSMALASILAGIAVLVMRITGLRKQTTTTDRLVVFLAVWWILDMTFVWISPRSYEQYYLPLLGSAAVLASYVCSFYSTKLNAAQNKLPWIAGGAVAGLVMILMSLHIFGGFYRSPHTGFVQKEKKYGYAQALERVSNSRKGGKGGWENVGEYIKERTSEDDKIYVWGWYPGIYVQAQRLCPASKAFESEMHVKSPQVLKKEIIQLLRAFRKNPPKYIVDSRKPHFPWTGFPFELWPTRPDGRGLIKNNKKEIESYDAIAENIILKRLPPKFDAAFRKKEAARYVEMGAFRKFVMDNYEPVQQIGYRQTPEGKKPVDMFAPHRVFKLKPGKPVQEPK